MQDTDNYDPIYAENFFAHLFYVLSEGSSLKKYFFLLSELGY